MVDPIGIKGATATSLRPVSVDAAAAAAAPKAVRGEEKSVETAASELSEAMAAEAPVDSERVARIRKAIEEGRFPILPSEIADRLIALKLQWDPNDPA